LYNNAGGGTGCLRYESPGRGFGRWAVATAGTTPGNRIGVSASGASNGVVGNWKPYTTYVVSFYAKTSAGSPLLGAGCTLGWNQNPSSREDIMNPGLTTEEQRYAFKIAWGSSVEGNGNLYLCH